MELSHSDEEEAARLCLMMQRYGKKTRKYLVGLGSGLDLARMGRASFR